jgi:hypothetical protein
MVSMTVDVPSFVPETTKRPEGRFVGTGRVGGKL